MYNTHTHTHERNQEYRSRLSVCKLNRIMAAKTLEALPSTFCASLSVKSFRMYILHYSYTHVLFKNCSTQVPLSFNFQRVVAFFSLSLVLSFCTSAKHDILINSFCVTISRSDCTHVYRCRYLLYREWSRCT